VSIIEKQHMQDIDMPFKPIPKTFVA